MKNELNSLQNLFNTKALVYENLGKEHFPIRNLEMYDKRCDISAHLHCEIVELWIAIIQNQSIEQVIDELVDILCLWNLALVQYKNAGGEKLNFNKLAEETHIIIKTDDYLHLVPDSKKDWKIYPDDLQGDHVKSIDDSIKRNRIKCIFNLGNGNEIDIFSLYHKVVNDLWNSIRKNKGLEVIYQNLIIIFAVWQVSIRVISNQMKFNISIENVIDLASDVFTQVAKKKFNIDI